MPRVETTNGELSTIEIKTVDVIDRPRVAAETLLKIDNVF